VFAIEIHYYILCMQVVMWFPGVVPCIVTLPFYKILHLVPTYSAVQNFLHFVLFFTVY
jgi:hypothetical protein